MNILSTLSNKKFFSYQHSDVPSIPVSNQGINNVNSKVENESTNLPDFSFQTSVSGEKRNENNLLRNYSTSIKLEDSDTDSYIDSGFDSRIKPSKSLIYNFYGMCWLIAILENFKSNEELRKYIFKNCTNENFLKGLRDALKIHEEEICEKDFESLISIFPDNKPTRLSGGSSERVVDLLMNNCVQKETEEGIRKIKPFFDIPGKGIDMKTKISFSSNGGLPFLKICVPEGNFKDRYLNISIISLPLKISTARCGYDYKSIILCRKPKFFMLNVQQFNNQYDISVDFKGIVIPKNLFIRIENMHIKKYSLTSILCRKKVHGNVFNHCVSFVKRGNKWYDTDYEYKKSCYGIYTPLFLKTPSIIDALNDKNNEKIIIDMAEHKNKLFVTFLFYQIEE